MAILPDAQAVSQFETAEIAEIHTLADPTSVAEESALIAWVGAVCGGEIVRFVKASGGNRRQSWAVDVRLPGGVIRQLFLRHDPRGDIAGIEPYTITREAEIYRAIAHIDIKAPRYVAENASLRAVLTDRAEGIAEFRHLRDPVTKQAIAHEFIDNIATLHRTDARATELDGGARGRIADYVIREVSLWKTMYEEVGKVDPLIDFAFAWLEANMPDPDGNPVIVHGDAGPGNFMFHEGHLTALIDWEFCHIGDPMEDIAWFSMRCVMEPVPDFKAALRHYEEAVGDSIDRARLLYHRVLVSARVCVIRHRNFAGEPAHAIVSRGLNRRLLVEALSVASGSPVSTPIPAASQATDHEWLYDRVITQLGDIVIPRSADKQVIAVVKNSAKVVKYLKALDRYGKAIDIARAEALAALLGAGTMADVPFEQALAYFAQDSLWEAQLSAEASGSIDSRHYDQF